MERTSDRRGRRNECIEGAHIREETGVVVGGIGVRGIRVRSIRVRCIRVKVISVRFKRVLRGPLGGRWGNVETN